MAIKNITSQESNLDISCQNLSLQNSIPLLKLELEKFPGKLFEISHFPTGKVILIVWSEIMCQYFRYQRISKLELCALSLRF